MEEVTTSVTAKEISYELARWYHDLAKLCVQAAEHHLVLTEDSAQCDLDKALALNEILRVRIATLQSVERAFRTEFPRLYIDHQVEKILSLKCTQPQVKSNSPVIPVGRKSSSARKARH